MRKKYIVPISSVITSLIIIFFTTAPSYNPTPSAIGIFNGENLVVLTNFTATGTNLLVKTISGPDTNGFVTITPDATNQIGITPNGYLILSKSTAVGDWTGPFNILNPGNFGIEGMPVQGSGNGYQFMVNGNIYNQTNGPDPNGTLDQNNTLLMINLNRFLQAALAYYCWDGTNTHNVGAVGVGNWDAPQPYARTVFIAGGASKYDVALILDPGIDNVGGGTTNVVIDKYGRSWNVITGSGVRRVIAEASTADVFIPIVVANDPVGTNDNFRAYARGGIKVNGTNTTAIGGTSFGIWSVPPIVAGPAGSTKPVTHTDGSPVLDGNASYDSARDSIVVTNITLRAANGNVCSPQISLRGGAGIFAGDKSVGIGNCNGNVTTNLFIDANSGGGPNGGVCLRDSLRVSTNAVMPSTDDGRVEADGGFYGNGIGITNAIKSVNGTYSVSTTDNLVLETASTNTTVTLPTAVGVAGKIYFIKNTGTATLTLGTTSSQNIDGATTKSMPTRYDCVQVESDGSQWWVIGEFGTGLTL